MTAASGVSMSLVLADELARLKKILGINDDLSVSGFLLEGLTSQEKSEANQS